MSKRRADWKDRTGIRYGRLVCIEPGPGQTWACRCDCGTIKTISTCNLIRSTRSCGCRSKEPHPITHGMTKTPEHACWAAMLTRCRNPKSTAFRNYGARGIKVCDRWLKFENFFADMGSRPPGLTLDRKNNNGDYEPGNCYWATVSEQNKNRRPRSEWDQTRRGSVKGENLYAKNNRIMAYLSMAG